LTTGSENVIIGNSAGAVNTTGIQNVYLGNSAGWSNTGSGNVIIGYKVGYGKYANASNRLMIDNNSYVSYDPLIYGEFDNRRVSINSLNPAGYTFFVGGTAGGTSAWQNYSDQRLKKNIITITGALERVMKLRGVNFEWNATDAPEKGVRMGFIAQEAEKVIPEVVNTEGKFYSMQYAPVTALLVEAMKEQQKIIEGQNAEIEALKARLQKIEDLLNKKCFRI
jgi:hypothetical protein